MNEFLQVLETQSELLIQKIQNNMSQNGINATGKTSQSFEYRITGNEQDAVIEILANAFAGVIETGRRPTPDKKPSREMIQSLTEWAGYVGLLEGSNTGIVWAIANTINKEGTKLWQKGGRTDIYTMPFEEFIKTLQSGVLEEVTEDFVKIIINANGKNF